jgi:hypothetical protein
VLCYTSELERFRAIGMARFISRPRKKPNDLGISFLQPLICRCTALAKMKTTISVASAWSRSALQPSTQL